MRPDRAQYLTVAFLHNATTLDVASESLPYSGLEAKPLAAGFLLAETWFGLALLAGSYWASRGRTPAGSRAMRVSALLATGLVLPLSLRTARFLDYVPPLLALGAGLFWPREGLRVGARRLLPAAALLSFPLAEASGSRSVPTSLLLNVLTILTTAAASISLVYVTSSPSLRFRAATRTRWRCEPPTSMSARGRAVPPRTLPAGALFGEQSKIGYSGLAQLSG